MRFSIHRRDGQSLYHAIGIAYGRRPLYLFGENSPIIHSITVMVIFWSLDISWGKNLPS